ncbi:MAG TPA: hypothetical protein VJQ79_06595 [Acidimicrobiia bacterium]|nr:hypothetical protein [Acidimicrobiia bacterium]
MTDRLRLLIATLLVAMLGAGLWYSSSAIGANEVEVGGEIEAATAAVEAWGSFAATGDIGLVDRWFAIDGPQYAQLQKEEESITPGGTYDFALRHGVVVEPGLVRGTVTITGGNQEPRTYQWDIELVHHGTHWKVWTVRTSPEEPRT